MGNRLDRMIARLTTQRACLRFAADQIADIPGPALEVGLGKGRTYDFLRSILPDRTIFAFDREIHAPADCVPDAEHLFVGDFRQTFSEAPGRIGVPAAMAHADIGSEDVAVDEELVAWLRERLPALVVPGGLVISDRALKPRGALSLPLPEGVADWPYYLYRLAET